MGQILCRQSSFVGEFCANGGGALERYNVYIKEFGMRKDGV